MPKGENKFHRYPVWAPRFWGGMCIGGWWRLLRNNGFRVSVWRIFWFLLISVAAPFNSLAALHQKLMFGRRIRNTELVGPPIFVIGHWRSGTTYLQELLSLDPKLAAPTTFQAYAANHFLASGWIVIRFLKWALPAKRPMDNVAISWDSPQEDEWALSTMGIPTPYHRIAFPQNSPPALDYLDMDNLTRARQDEWCTALLQFFRSVTLATGKRLVLKSPHHTGRIHVLRKLFPEARFIHISRDPYTLLPSTVRMYRAFDHSQSLQVPFTTGLEEYVLQTGQRIYESYLRHVDSIPPNRICEISFEQLTEDGVGTMQRVYQQLELGDFSEIRESLQTYVTSRKSYQKNRYEFPDEWKRQLETSWKAYFQRFRYPQRED